MTAVRRIDDVRGIHIQNTGDGDVVKASALIVGERPNLYRCNCDLDCNEDGKVATTDNRSGSDQRRLKNEIRLYKTWQKVHPSN
jgi:hypothetical protein